MMHEAKNSFLVTHDRQNVHARLLRDAKLDAAATDLEAAAATSEVERLRQPYGVAMAVPAESTAKTAMPARAIRAQLDANVMFRDGQYIAAIDKYSAALQFLRVCSTVETGAGLAIATTLLNRAACFIHSGGYNTALQVHRHATPPSALILPRPAARLTAVVCHVAGLQLGHAHRSAAQQVRLDPRPARAGLCQATALRRGALRPECREVSSASHSAAHGGPALAVSRRRPAR